MQRGAPKYAFPRRAWERVNAECGKESELQAGYAGAEGEIPGEACLAPTTDRLAPSERQFHFLHERGVARVLLAVAQERITLHLG